MSERTLLVAALALMAGGLLLGGIGIVFGDGATPAQSEQVLGPGSQPGAQGQPLPRRPGFGPGFRPGAEAGEGNEKANPLPATSPSPKPSATP